MENLWNIELERLNWYTNYIKIFWKSNEKKSKKKYYSDKISKYKHDAKELIGKVKLKSSSLPRKITVNEVDIFDEPKNCKWI